MFVSRTEFARKNRLVAQHASAAPALQELPGGRTQKCVAIFVSISGRTPVGVIDVESARRLADAIHDAADAIEGIEP